jgi:DNA helicase-2/ATP-dependent DNA helicase PcrA
MDKMADRPSYLPDNLTDQQVEAILFHGRPLLIIAGPGSGKTEVISWRAAHLIKSGADRPEDLLVTTFTNKAAFELKDRIQRKLPEINVELMQISTIHSFCAGLLRKYAVHSRLPANFHILDDRGQFLFVYAHRKQLGLDEIVKGRPIDFFNNTIGVFNLATEEMVDPVKFRERCEQKLTESPEDQADLWREHTVISGAYQRYVDLLIGQHLADFAHLQQFAVELVETHPDIRQELRQRFREVLVDEYQDTNAAQVHLLAAILGEAGEGLTVVGDDDQSIYRFRGATVKNILHFEEHFPDAKRILLVNNFRSFEPIVAHSLKVIVHNPARFDKQLVTMRGTGSDVLLVYEHTADDEATAVVRLLKQLHDQGKIKRWSDVAILLRSVKSYAAPYVAALQAAGIPHAVLGSEDFFAREDISQLYDVLVRFLGATKEWGDKFVCSPLVGLSDETIKALKAHKANLLDSADEKGLQEIGIENVDDRRRLLGLLGLKQEILAKKHASFLSVLYRLLEITGYFARSEATGQAETLQNIGVLSQLIAAFDAFGGTRNYYPFQDYMQLIRQGGEEPVIEPPPDPLQIMTIHQAKGLEWPVVVVGSVMNGRLPATARKAPYDIPYDLRASGSPEVDDPHLVDERKLFYVAATRARDLLILSTADVVNKRGGGPSIFLHEMFGDNLKTFADYSQAKVLNAQSRDNTPLGPRERYSFSRLAYFLQCPVRYKYAVYYGMETPLPDPVDFGANVHRALEVLHERARTRQAVYEDDIAGIIHETWQRNPLADEKQDEAAQRAAVEQLKRYVNSHAADLARVDRAEAEFAFQLQAKVLLGKIDLIRRDADVASDLVEIVDFKTSKSLPVELEQIDTQMDLYALGAEAHFGVKVGRQIVHFLGDDRVQSWKWSEERRELAQSKLTDTMANIAGSNFEPRTSYCVRCAEFRIICPYASKPLVAAQNPQKRRRSS